MSIHSAAYDTDFDLWTQGQAVLLRERTWHDIASEVLAEEAEKET